MQNKANHNLSGAVLVDDCTSKYCYFKQGTVVAPLGSFYGLAKRAAPI